MKKQQLVTSLALSAMFLLPASASYAFESSANVAVTSNYVFRGLTQSNDGVAVQGGYDIKQGKDDLGWYAGAFASTVDGGAFGGNGLEVDVTGGWRGNFDTKSNLGYDVGAVVYKYTDSKFSSDHTELFAGINYETAYVKLFLGSGPGVDNYNYLDGGMTFIVMKDLDLDVHAGHFSSSNNTYNDLSARLGTEVKGYDLGLSLTYQDLTTKENIEFFVTVGKTFDL